MAVRAVTSLSEFQAVIRQPKLTVVDFFATWCGPCKAIAPHVHKLAEQKPNVNFLKIDVDQAGEIAQEYRIRAMPTFMFFKNGNKISAFEGADFNQLMSIVQQHDTPAPAPIPSDDAVAAMSPKELLALMKDHNIPSAGLLEKTELLEQIKKYR